MSLTHTHTQINKHSNYFLKKPSLFFFLKKFFLLSMWKDPQLKVTQSFPTIPTIPIYKAQILYIDGQGLSNYFYNREYFFHSIQRRIVFFYHREKLFLSYQRNLIVKPKSKQEFEIISNTLNLQEICNLLGIYSWKSRKAS